MIVTSFLSVVKQPVIAGILSIYTGRCLALKWKGISSFGLILL